MFEATRKLDATLRPSRAPGLVIFPSSQHTGCQPKRVSDPSTRLSLTRRSTRRSSIFVVNVSSTISSQHPQHTRIPDCSFSASLLSAIRGLRLGAKPIGTGKKSASNNGSMTIFTAIALTPVFQVGCQGPQPVGWPALNVHPPHARNLIGVLPAILLKLLPETRLRPAVRWVSKVTWSTPAAPRFGFHAPPGFLKDVRLVYLNRRDR